MVTDGTQSYVVYTYGSIPSGVVYSTGFNAGDATRGLIVSTTDPNFPGGGATATPSSGTFRTDGR